VLETPVLESHASCPVSKSESLVKFIYTLMEMPGHDIEVEACHFTIGEGGTLIFHGNEGEIVRAVNARVWRVCEAA
jgi:hypothetical protein